MPAASVKLRRKNSSASLSLSPLMTIEMVLVVSPGLKVIVPGEPWVALGRSGGGEPAVPRRVAVQVVPRGFTGSRDVTPVVGTVSRHNRVRHGHGAGIGVPADSESSPHSQVVDIVDPVA